MPKIDECIKAKIAAGDFDDVAARKAGKAAKDFREEVDKVMEQFGVSRTEAEQAIADVLIGIRTDATTRRKSTALAQNNVILDMLDHIKKHVDAGQGADVAVLGRLSFDPRGRYTGPSVDIRTKVVKGIAHARMEKFLEKFRRRMVGTSQKLDGIEDITAEMFGKGSGSVAAKEMADSVNDTINYLMARLQKAGVNVNPETKGLFHRWDSTRVAKIGQEEWINFVWERLDRAAIKNDLGLTISEADLRLQLGDIHKSIVSKGLSDVVELQPQKGQTVASATKRESTTLGARQGGGRFLQWKSPDDWIDIHKEFGRGNLFEHITSTVDQLSRDVAIAEVLGPHPKATFKRMEKELDAAFAEGALSSLGMKAARLSERIGGPKSHLNALFDVVTGNANATDHGIVASVFQANRNILISALLGSSMFSGLSDTVLASVTARMNGVPVFATLGRIMKTFKPGVTDKELAINLGFTAQGWSDRAIGAQRVMGEITGDRFTERMADVAMRASLLSPWTEAGRWGFGMEMLNHIGMQSEKTLAQLDKATKASFERHGITEADWNIIRNTQKWVDPESGARFIRAEDVAAGGTDEAFSAGNKLQEAIFIETEFAIPASNPRVQAGITQGTPAGTFVGELTRNIGLFKSFPISIIYLHWQRAMNKRNPISRAEYAAWGFIGMTMIGSVGEQLNNISQGKEPQPINPDLLLRGAIRGGAGGLIADVLLKDHGFGGGFVMAMLGPVAEQLNIAITDLTTDNLRAAFDEDTDSDVGRQLKRLFVQSAPGHTLFYGKLAFERLITDEVERLVNPKAAAGFRRRKKRLKEQQDTEFFSPPGGGLF